MNKDIKIYIAMGYGIGKHKITMILSDKNDLPELMYDMVDYIFDSKAKLKYWLLEYYNMINFSISGDLYQR